MTDDTRAVLLHVQRAADAANQAASVRTALRDADPREVIKHTAGILPGDSLALRGIPVQAVGVGGTMLGTQPEREACR